jgi:hypothetical protein
MHVTQAQEINSTDSIIHFSDPKFKEALLKSSTRFNIAMDSNGNSIVIDKNGDNEIQLSEALLVYNLDIENSNVKDISDLTGIKYFTNLEKLKCRYANLANLNLSKNINLKELRIFDNKLTSLNLPESNKLEYLDVSINKLTELNVTKNIKLKTLNFSGNQLTYIDISNNTELEELILLRNKLTTIDVSKNINLKNLYCDWNNLTEIDISKNINLISLGLKSNNLSKIDASNNHSLINLRVSENSSLAFLNLKTGNSNSVKLLNSLENAFGQKMASLINEKCYICVDDFEISNVNKVFSDLKRSMNVSTYCSYSPGGNNNTITGKLLYDYNNDTCTSTKTPISYEKIMITDKKNADTGINFTNKEGEYIFYTKDGDFEISPVLKNIEYYEINPIKETVNFPYLDNSIKIQNFCAKIKDIKDLQIKITPINVARPGFEAQYEITYKNLGKDVESLANGINLDFNNKYMTYVSSSETPSTITDGKISWNYTTLKHLETKKIIVTMKINPPTHATDPINIDDILKFTAEINPIERDENPEDNTFVFNQTVVGAYDPNDITCLEGDKIETQHIGKDLHYLIRFENTGNYSAENIIVTMDIDDKKYDLKSLNILSTSHNSQARITKDNRLEIFFEKINLQEKEEGNILLSIKTLESLQKGDSVMSKADIYFDYNFPIITNEAITSFEELLVTVDQKLKETLSIHPNPVQDKLILDSKNKIKSIELYDTTGKLIKTSVINDFKSTQNLSSLKSGVYILKAQTNKGVIIQKLIKQ